MPLGRFLCHPSGLDPHRAGPPRCGGITVFQPDFERDVRLAGLVGFLCLLPLNEASAHLVTG